MQIDWDHVYILGWYGRNGRSYLTTWDGDLPYVTAVVTGAHGLNMPMWNAPVPRNAELHAIPEDKDADEYAREVNGFKVLAWYVEGGIDRQQPCAC